MPNVDEGDCILSIADRLGFRDYHVVWDFGGNSALRGERPNPNMLVKGDVVEARAKEEKKLAADTGARHKYKVKGKPAKLRIVLFDSDGKPIPDKEWELASPVSKKGKTAADGLIEIDELPVQATAGSLKVTMKAPPAEAPPSEAPPSEPPPPDPPTDPIYPRPIKAEEYKDPKPAALDPADDIAEWDLKIGSLPSFNHETGVQARLQNLGFRCEPGSDGDATQRAVKAYQRAQLKQKDGSGVATEIQAGLRDHHDNP